MRCLRTVELRLDSLGLSTVTVERTTGRYADRYDPQTKTLYLSKGGG
ncbi:MAG: zinc metallopeptidase [Armatimonadota bacterium]|nr:zinc metallopeptidase [Armatimonadota bacterium]MDR5702397.1 zinc metallopeptidase [Armatimonadota bacterium]MDR7435490.1 zinc metallopeptidase [Armatimonadota bacterium]